VLSVCVDVWYGCMDCGTDVLCKTRFGFVCVCVCVHVYVNVYVYVYVCVRACKKSVCVPFLVTAHIHTSYTSYTSYT
jgi:hypothetical protein